MDIYRTAGLDEVLRHILLIENDFEAVFAGKQGEILKKSLWLDPAGHKPNTINPDLVC
jgi:hypothetical protein